MLFAKNILFIIIGMDKAYFTVLFEYELLMSNTSILIVITLIKQCPLMLLYRN